jgi:hypothetical protein
MSLEAWKYRQARAFRKVALNGQTIQATIEDMVSHAQIPEPKLG